MKLCRNIHRSVWQLMGGVEKIQNGGRFHGNQSAKKCFLSSLQASQIFAVMFPVTPTSSGMR